MPILRLWHWFPWGGVWDCFGFGCVAFVSGWLVFAVFRLGGGDLDFEARF